MHVVVIDSGLNCHEALKGILIKECWDVKQNGDGNSVSISKVVVDDIPDTIGHGTSVTSILYNYDHMTEFTIIRAFGVEEELSPQILQDVLIFVLDKIACDIINLSCGCEEFEHVSALSEICRKIEQRGTIIVAAYSNAGAMTYPAAFNKVIGVDYSLSCFKAKDFFYYENSQINVRGMGYPQRLPTQVGKYTMQAGSSFVVPHIVGVIIRNLNNEKCSYDTACSILKRNAKQITCFSAVKKEESVFNIKQACIVPYTKESDVLMRFAGLLNFKIGNVLSPRYYLPRSRQLLQKNENDQFQITSYENYDWESAGDDTIIIGHIHLLSRALGMNLKKEILGKCLRYHKNVYLFDTVDNDWDLIAQLKEQGQHVFTPQVQNYEDRNLGKLFVHSSPIVGIFGTGPKQGKFSLELRLRKYLTDVGYKTGCVGSEPTAPLFGFEACYPYGYNSTVSISGNTAISYLNREINKIDRSNPDLILLGAQSQTISSGVGHISYYNAQQHEILLAAQPDAFILCIYANDDADYVQQTVYFLEAATGGNVIALVTFPFLYKNSNGMLSDDREKVPDAKLNLFAIQMQEQLHKPVFSFLDSSLERKLLALIQNEFS